MKKKEACEFKRHFYLNWFVQDWLGDQNLKLCPPDAKGFWMDLLMQMVLSFPFGHLSRLSKPLMKQSNLPLVKNILLGSLVYQNPDQNPDQSGNQNPNQDADQSGGQDNDQWVRLSVGLSLPQQLTLAINLEEKIPELTGYSPDKVAEWLGILDDLNIYSRTPSGIIYNRRMVRDFQKRKNAFINACRGVNPYEHKPKSRKRSMDLVYQNPDQSADQSANQNGKQTADQSAYQNPGELVAGPPHQFPSNSNSNSNSNYSDSSKSSIQSIGNGRVKEKEEESEKKESMYGRAGGNGEKLEKLDFTGLQGLKAKVLADQSLLDPLLMATGLKEPALIPWLDMFNLHLVVERKLEKDYRDYCSHFRNWIFKQDLSKKPPSAKEVKDVARNHQKSKDLLGKYATIV